MTSPLPPPLSLQLRQRIELALGSGITHSRPLAGGNIAAVSKIVTADGRTFAIKQMQPRSQPTKLRRPTLKDEAFMLNRLRQSGTVPVPEVVHAEKDLLILDYILCDDVLDLEASGGSAQTALADCIAALHGVRVKRFGFDFNTPIGPLQRPNPWTESWLPFFRDHRLLFLGNLADAAGRLPEGCLARLNRLCGQLDRWIPEDRPASLIHGDLWINNILFREGQVAALIDPATYFADAEIELAFLTLFGGIGESFFARYQEHHPIDRLFFEERRAIYHLEPLLAHAWFFGGGYGDRVDEILRGYVG